MASAVAVMLVAFSLLKGKAQRNYLYPCITAICINLTRNFRQESFRHLIRRIDYPIYWDLGGKDLTGNLFRSQSWKADLDGVPQIPMHFKAVSAVANVSPSIQNTATLTTPETAPST